MYFNPRPSYKISSTFLLGKKKFLHSKLEETNKEDGINWYEKGKCELISLKVISSTMLDHFKY